MTLDEAIEYEKESLQHCKRKLEDIYEDNLENKILKFEVKQHEHLAEWLEDYKHIKQWKSDVMDGFCRYDASSFEELVANARNKAIDDFVKEYKRKTPMENRLIDEIAEQLKVNRMSRDKAETIAYAIRKECQRSSLYDWCESWDITIDEFEEFLSNGIKGSEME